MPSGSKPTPRKATPQTVTPSSGNVFADIGVPRPELSLAKADLALRLCEAIVTRGLTPSQAGLVLKLSPQRLTDLKNGALTGFSLDRLITLLNRLELDVEIAVKPARGPQKTGGTSVVLS
jgi:predicted XRE-type DNA-binding protein